MEPSDNKREVRPKRVGVRLCAERFVQRTLWSVIPKCA
jgi:hypothetical protein